jgi:hypothetical protein
MYGLLGADGQVLYLKCRALGGATIRGGVPGTLATNSAFLRLDPGARSVVKREKILLPSVQFSDAAVVPNTALSALGAF